MLITGCQNVESVIWTSLLCLKFCNILKNVTLENLNWKVTPVILSTMMKFYLNEHKATVHGLQSSSQQTGKKPDEGFGEKELLENNIESVQMYCVQHIL